jgi:hypothetical protein
MREFATFTRDFALSVAVHGRESALACRHRASVDGNSGALPMPVTTLLPAMRRVIVKSRFQV